MSDDAQTPAAPDNGAGHWPAAPGDATGRVPLDKPEPTPEPMPEPNPWAPPAADASSGPGRYTGAGQFPAAPSAHDQRTVVSMPGAGAGGTPPPSQPWAGPFAPPTPMPQTPGAVPSHSEPVPPPPIAPDGPGQVPYGYPGGYGHPAGSPSGYGTPGYGSPGYYGWPGMTPLPSNGMGIASMVLGIVGAAVFCLWPIAIIVGVLALIFGFIGRAKAARGEATNPGQALTGIICGAVGIVLGLGMIALLIANP
ncbi:DUF4190 domain-containing protein [Streptomyces sp. NPDC020996]|uniref:DUF4190 domain-containing protein n=1 Tax=Streptomyces sp. NPDC020996 TaxID=3154791 RepID=UPI0034022206